MAAGLRRVSRLSATSREPEEWASATVGARRTRESVAEQVRALIIEGDRMGGRAEVAARIQRLVEAERLIAEAKGRQEQAAQEGLPAHEHAEAEREGRSALRAAVMSLSVAAGSWVAAIDHEQVASHRGSAEPAAI